MNRPKGFFIYNSRNYKGLVAINDLTHATLIYNSRNYKGLVALSVCKDKQYNLDINDFLY